MSAHERIKLIRQAKGFTQEEIAEQINMSPNAYGDIERGISDPKLSKLQKISEVLGVDLAELLDFNTKTTLNLNFTKKQGKHYTVYMGGNIDMEKLEWMIEAQKKEISYLKEIIELMKKNSLN